MTQKFPELATRTEVALFLLASARRQRALWRRTAVIAVVVALVITALGIVSEILRELAEHRRVLALSRALAIESKTEPAPDRALLLAAQAYAEAPTSETTGNLLDRIQTWPNLRRILHSENGALQSVIWDTRNNSVITGTSNGYLQRWSAETYKVEGPPVRASKGAVRSLALAGDQGAIGAGYEDGRVLVWDRSGNRSPVEGIPPGFELKQIADVNGLSLGPPIGAVALSRDGTLAAVGTAKGTGNGFIFFIDQPYRRILGPPISVGVPRVNTLDFDLQASFLVAGTGFGTVALVDVRRRMLMNLKGPKMSEILAVRFAGNQDLIAVDDVGRTSHWKRSGPSFRLVDSFRTADALTSVAVSPDGGIIAVGDARGTVQLFSVETHKRVRSFQAHTGSVNSLAWASQGENLISAGADGTADIWDFGQSSPLAASQGKLRPRVIALRSVNGNIMAARSSVGSAGLWQMDGNEWKLRMDLLKSTLTVLGQDRFTTPEPEVQGSATFIPVPAPEIERVEITSQGQGLIWTTRNGAVLWSSLTENAHAIVLYDVKFFGAGSVTDLSLGQSGRYLAVAYSDHRILLFDLRQGNPGRAALIKTINVPVLVRSLTLNRTETMLALGLEDGSIALWSVPAGIPVTAPKKPHMAPVGNLTFTTDGSRLFSNAVIGDGAETALTVSPVPSLTPSTPLIARTSGDPPMFIRLDKELLVAVDNDGKISYWDSEKLEPLGFSSPSSLPLTTATLDTENHRLVVADEDGWIQTFRVGGDNWQGMACRLANRLLTSEEWAEFLKDERYAPACETH